MKDLGRGMRSLDGGKSLSLGDRCRLALTVRRDLAKVIAADRAWA